jgi:hypothetical protein
MASPREDFSDAVAFFVNIVSEVKPDQWSIPARGERTVLDVVAQGSRPLTTTHEFLTAGAETEELASTLAYFIRTKPLDPSVTEGIQARGREALERLRGGDPATIVAALAEAALKRVGDAKDDELVGTQYGGMRLLSYLPTRTMELVTCGVEVADAIGSNTTPPAGPVESAAQLLCQVAIARGNGPRLVKAIWTQVQLG